MPSRRIIKMMKSLRRGRAVLIEVYQFTPTTQETPIKGRETRKGRVRG
jgi:hypothetical protein